MAEETIRAEAVQMAAQVIARVALDMIEEDSHHFGTRPCQTCNAVSRLLNRQWGCVKVRHQAEALHG